MPRETKKILIIFKECKKMQEVIHFQKKMLEIKII